MQWPRVSRRWLVAGGIVTGVALLVVLGLAVIYPRVGAHMIRDKVGGRLASKLGRTVTFGAIDVSIGHAVMRDIVIRGEHDGQTPLVHIDRAEVAFDGWASLVGKIVPGVATIEGVQVAVRRNGDGTDNVQDLFTRVREQKQASGGSTLGTLRPTKLTVTKIHVIGEDAVTGTTVLVSDADVAWTPALLLAHGRKLTATTPGAPKAELASVEIRKATGVQPVVTLDGGELSLWPKMALSGISGTIVANPKQPGDYMLDVAGGWGGVPGTLWTAKGHFDPKAQAGALDLEAAKFQLARLAPILQQSAVVDYQTTSVDTKLHVDVQARSAKFAGSFDISGLNVGHPMIADKEVHDLNFNAQIAGSYDRATRTIELTRGDFVARDVPFSVTGSVVRVSRQVASEAPDQVGPARVQQLKMRLVIPPISCQRVIDAIPAEMAPYMQGYKIKGMFDTDIELDIDWTNLDALVLDGHVGINHCKVVDEPEDSPKRLEEPFEHYVEVEKDEWVSFIVGPENEDFVPFEDISPYLVKSITTTEDGAFYKHHGFIPSQFRTALVTDLKARSFRYGASSITMQMVKNVLLYREKTLARKLQELFLTWEVEHVLTKDRILEIYFNVIEYGPGLYGIGPAAKHFFGKPAKDLTPTEAAFFSSILPSPKERYKQYCQGTLTKWTTGKIERILQLMLSRDKITQEEYDKAIATPLAFVKDSDETEKQCLDRVKKAIKNARPTNPLKK